MIEWNITMLKTKKKDKAKEEIRKKKLKKLGEEIFKQDASHAFVDASFISFRAV